MSAKTFVLLFVFFGFIATGCKKEKTPEEMLVGKWEIQFLHTVSYVDNVFLGDSTAYYDTGDAWIEYKDNRTGKVYFKDVQNDEFTWSVEEDIITIDFTTGNQNTVYLTFSVSDTQLTWYSTMNERPYTPNPAKTYKELWYLWAERL
jgi:hypothetical protein